MTKLERARQIGAHDGINYRSNPDWSSAVLALTDGRGADHIIEVGGPQSFAQSLKAAARGAQINVIGYLGGSEGGRSTPSISFAARSGHAAYLSGRANPSRR